MNSESSREGIKIVPFVTADLDEIMEIEEVSFAAPWSRQAYLDIAFSETIFFFVVKEAGRLVGYMLYQAWGEEMELHTFAVAPDRRRTGIAKKILEHMISDARARGARRIFLQVRPSNTAARSLYEKFGFNVISVRPHYYRDDQEDALVMRLEIL